MKITVESTIENLNDIGVLEGEPEIHSICAEAKVINENGATVICYTEENEGGKTETVLTVFDDSVLLERRGAIEWRANFKEGCTESTVYRIPPYAFDCKVCTKRIRKSEDNGLTLRLFYLMDIGGGKKNAKMKITLGK